MAQIKPNLFIVGAGKAGTFAMYHYLNQHPEVFMSPIKEPNYFGSDLLYRQRRITLDEYLAMFDGAQGKKAIGEASVRYLMSKSAPMEIASFSSDPRIVIMLRDPIEVLHSRHSQNVKCAVEDILEFKQAIEAEEERRQGLRIPAGAEVVNDLFYSDWIKFTEQCARYIAQFGRDRVSIILYDDFRKDPISCFRKLCTDIGVSDDFSPPPERINENKKIRSHFINRAAKGKIKPITLLSRILLPSANMRKAIKEQINKFNSISAKRIPLEHAFEYELRIRLSQEIDNLSQLIGRDLSHWKQPTFQANHDTALVRPEH